jgi:hypothetical protein
VLSYKRDESKPFNYKARFDPDQLIRDILWARRNKKLDGVATHLTVKHLRPITTSFVLRVLRASVRARGTLRPPTLLAALRRLEKHTNDRAYWLCHRMSNRRWSRSLFELHRAVGLLIGTQPDTDKHMVLKARFKAVIPGRKPRLVRDGVRLRSAQIGIDGNPR